MASTCLRGRQLHALTDKPTSYSSIPQRSQHRAYARTWRVKRPICAASKRLPSGVAGCFLRELHTRRQAEFGVDVGEVGLDSAR